MDELTGDDDPLLAVEPAYKHVLRARQAGLWALVCAAALIVDRTLLAPTFFQGMLPVLVPIIALVAIVGAPQRVYLRLRYRLTGRFLQVLRGWLFHTDTIVPLVRVQHIDVSRGPIEKLFGTATLVVHTAGTHNSIVTVPGLAPQTAAAIRDTIREHVRTDFE